MLCVTYDIMEISQGILISCVSGNPEHLSLTFLWKV